MVIFLQGHHNVAVVCSKRTVGQMLRVQGAVRQADVVQNVVDLARGNLFAYFVFDQIKEARGLFNAKTGRPTYVEDELAAVGIGEEVFAKEGKQEKHNKAGQQECGNEDAAS